MCRTACKTGLGWLHISAAQLLLALIGLNVMLGSLATAQTASWLSIADRQLERWQAQLQDWQAQPPSPESIEARIEEVSQLRQQADACSEELAAPMRALEAKLSALGEPSDNEETALQSRRQELVREKQRLDTQTSLCRVLSVAGKELLDQLKDLRARSVKSALGQREQPIWESLQIFLQSPAVFTERAKRPLTLWPTVLVPLAALWVLFPSARGLAGFLRRRYPQPTPPAAWRPGSLFAHRLATRLPWIAALAALSLFAHLAVAPLLGAAFLALLSAMVLAPLLEMALCQSVYRCVGGLPVRILMLLLLMAFGLWQGGVAQMLTSQAADLLYVGFAGLLLLNSLWLLYALASRADMRMLSGLRVPLTLLLAAGPVALGLGYHSLAEFLLTGIYGSLLGVLVVWMLYRPFSVLFRLLDTDPAENSAPLRSFLGYQDQEPVPGLWLGRFLLVLFMLLLLGYWGLFVWNVPESEMEALGSYLTQGFKLGGISLVPAKLITAVIAFLLVLTLARWLRNQLSERWLSKTRLDSGARQSIVALSSYTIVGLAIMGSLSMAGLDLQNLAILAGALSVGIGFGLQNIVNNFVSGLILLFERPVRPGDWIVVGATEGFVKRVSIRSTQIETFDKADVLVPNSELISSQVTNLMLYDRFGRVIVPVGVAYGSDTSEVKRLLEEVANAHPQVLTKHPDVLPPKVLFIAFGDNSLNFELRVFVREIDRKMGIRSDLLFAIDKAFREAGIEIPFPQRVVHLPAEEKKAPPEQADD